MVKCAKTFLLMLAEEKYGHPMNWPTFHRVRPKWWQINKIRSERDACYMFGEITDERRKAYFDEIGKGQSIYEDAGGFLLRAYRAMLGLSVDEPYSYHAAFKDMAREIEE